MTKAPGDSAHEALADGLAGVPHTGGAASARGNPLADRYRHLYQHVPMLLVTRLRGTNQVPHSSGICPFDTPDMGWLRGCIAYSLLTTLSVLTIGTTGC